MGGPPLILVVDGEEGIRALLSFELTARGCRVDAAVDSHEALVKLSWQKYSLIIAATETVRPEYPRDVPLIVMSGTDGPVTRFETAPIESFGVLLKPFPLGDMTALVERALARRDLRDILGLYEAGKSLFTEGNADTLLTRVTELCLRTTGTDDAVILPAGEPAPAPVVVGMADPELRAERLRVARCLLPEAEGWEGIKIVEGNHAGDPWARAVEDMDRVRFALFHALKFEGKVMGILNLNRVSSGDPFSPADTVSVPLYAAQMARLLRNAALARRMEDKIAELNRLLAGGDAASSAGLPLQLGRYLAGALEDFTDPLGGLLRSTGLLLESRSTFSEEKESVQVIRRHAERCMTLIQGLVRFSRARTPEAGPVDLESPIESTLRLLVTDMRRAGVIAQVDVPPHYPKIKLGGTALRQVFMNLFLNALQAMKGKSGGRLTVRARRNGNMARVAVEDTGCGIAPELMDKIFDPYFTTRPAGEGSGLGLALCRDILREGGGRLVAQSRVNRGAIFLLDLPLAEAGVAAPAEKPGRTSARISSRGTG
jgi:signal transduction histidine kinase/CheY-like chemotaxis protein